MSVFGASYSSAYDSLYRDKDYERECAVVTSLAGALPPATFLDLGCGTGGHAVRLAERGYDVLGVDRSAAMLEVARRKSEAAGVSNRTEFVEGDVRSVSLGRICDAALMMFAVLGYQESDGDVLAALTTVARHLVPGAPFIFDVWYGPAVLADPPGARRREIEGPEGKIVRTTESQLRVQDNLCSVHFTLEKLKGGAVVETTRETHVMRYFFPDELRRFAEAVGFRCEHIGDFNDPAKPATDSSWNAIVLFRKS